MMSQPWQRKAPRLAVAGTALALASGIAFVGLRGDARQQEKAPPPVQPSPQLVSLQNAFEQVAEKLRPSVVFIQSRQTLKVPSNFQQFGEDDGPSFRFFGDGTPFRSMPRRTTASGSGVIVRNDGYILTNDHVVGGADKVTVRLQDGRELPGKVSRDFRSDLALVKVEATGLPAAQLADSEQVKIGQWAIAFGAPFGLNDTMTAGIVSSLHRDQNIGQRVYSSLIQTDASINPGNSGGPLVDIYGRVIGINVAIETPTGGNVGIGFAIPAKTAKYVMDQLITKGKVTRGYLGVQPATLSFDEKQQYGVKEGALIRMVSDDAPAAKAGLQVEDVVVKFDGQPVKDDASLRDLVARSRPGATVPIVIKRNGAEKTFNVTVGTAPDQLTGPKETAPPKREERSKLGLQVASPSDADIRRQFNLKENMREGAVVVEVAPGSPAATAGIRPGDIIQKLNGRAITSPEQLAEVASGLKEGAAVSAVVRRGEQQFLAQLELE